MCQCVIAVYWNIACTVTQRCTGTYPVLCHSAVLGHTLYCDIAVYWDIAVYCDIAVYWDIACTVT